jgi:hypothetical protein
MNGVSHASGERVSPALAGLVERASMNTATFLAGVTDSMTPSPSSQDCCPTCGVQDPLLNEYCSDGFHAPGDTYWPPEVSSQEEARELPTEAMFEAAWHAHRRAMGMSQSPFQRGRGDCREVYTAIYQAMQAARPTPDLGDVDELVRKALALLGRYRNETPPGHQPHMIAHEVDDTIIALRAALDKND